MKFTHIRESRRWFSVQRSQRGVAGTISLEIPGQASARPTSSAIGASSAIMPFAKSSAVCSSELEKMVTELRQKWSGSTARPAVELAVRHRHVIAHSFVLVTCPERSNLRCRANADSARRAGGLLSSERLTIHDRLQRSADQADPNPPEPHRRPSQSPQRPLSRAAPRRPPEPSER